MTNPTLDPARSSAALHDLQLLATTGGRMLRQAAATIEGALTSLAKFDAHHGEAMDDLRAFLDDFNPAQEPGEIHVNVRVPDDLTAEDAEAIGEAVADELRAAPTRLQELGSRMIAAGKLGAVTFPQPFPVRMAVARAEEEARQFDDAMQRVEHATRDMRRGPVQTGDEHATRIGTTIGHQACADLRLVLREVDTVEIVTTELAEAMGRLGKLAGYESLAATSTLYSTPSHA